MAYVYCNDGMSFHAVDATYVPAEGEILSETEKTEEELSALFPAFTSLKLKEDKKLQINLLEASVTPRRLRDAVLTEEGKTWLQDIEGQISALRASLSATP